MTLWPMSSMHFRSANPQWPRYINYRDLGVQQLGSYERLLEQEIVRDGVEIAVRPNVFARKGSGSYYTPDDLAILDPIKHGQNILNSPRSNCPRIAGLAD